MPIIIKSTYSKKLGLPGYSSHSYSLTVETELSDLSQLEKQSSTLYSILQSNVDREIQEIGFIPETNGHGLSAPRTQVRSTSDRANRSNEDQWACSDKQRDLILKIVDEHKLDKQEVEDLAKQLFAKPVKVLNRLESSGLIENLLNQYGPKKANGNGRRQYQRGGARQ